RRASWVSVQRIAFLTAVVKLSDKRARRWPLAEHETSRRNGSGDAGSPRGGRADRACGTSVPDTPWHSPASAPGAAASSSVPPTLLLSFRCRSWPTRRRPARLPSADSFFPVPSRKQRSDGREPVDLRWQQAASLREETWPATP